MLAREMLYLPPMNPPLPFSMKIPCCALPEAVDISTTMLMSDVACETCQWIPVPVFGGCCRRSMTKLRMERKKLFWFVYQFAPPAR
jgi:hypothetical protein